MDKMIHINLKAMQGIMNRQTAIANNMANVSTIGFRADRVVFDRCDEQWRQARLWL